MSRASRADGRRAAITPRAAAAAGALAGVLLASGCAKSVFPPGGPLDATPPLVVAAAPADSSTRVAPDADVEILFSESMDHASVRDALKVYPPLAQASLDWSGRRVRISWGEARRPNTTYHVLIGARARDEHGIALGAPFAIHFSTGDSLAPGAIRGTVRARTLRRGAVPVLVFDAALGDRPDTAAEWSPLYEAETDTSGAYELAGLPLERPFRIFALYDRNGNGIVDTDQDVLAAHPQAIRLTPARTVADSIDIVAIDPEAPALLSGTIAGPDSSARFRVEARGDPDSTVARRVDRVGPGAFTLRVPAGAWTLRAIRLPGAEGVPPAREVRRAGTLVLGPEEERTGIVFTFPAEAAPPRPPDEE